MMIRGFALMIASVLACSGSDTDTAPTAQRPGPESTDEAVAETLPLEPADSESADSESADSESADSEPADSEPAGSEPAGYVVFVEPGTGFMTDAVHDADREVVHLDTERGAIVSAGTGAVVSGWQVNGAALSWSRFGVPFLVRFGTENGERRAYFTEAGPGTICNLRFSGDERLSISGTSETPPNP